MKKYLLLAILFFTLVGCKSAPAENTPTTTPSPVATFSAEPSSNPSPIPTLEADLPVYPDPITGFFESCRFEPGVRCTPFDSYFLALEAEAWKREAEHIFQILKENAHPDIKQLGIDMEQMETDIHTFVDAQSELYAHICFTSALGEEDGKWGELVFRGTGFGAGNEQARAAIYETVVKEFYAWCLHYPKAGESYVSDYVFDPDEVLAELEANGITCTVEPYEINIPVHSWMASETPIDTWVKDHSLYSDGSTNALSHDAYMEAGIWKAELEHLYSLLQECANPIAELDPVIQKSQDALFAFVPAFGEVESLYSHSGLFIPEAWRNTERSALDLWASCGTIHSMELWLNQTYFYRKEVLRMREALCNRIGEKRVTWAFDPALYEAELQEFYGEEWGKS